MVCAGGVAVWCVLWVVGAAVRWFGCGPPRYFLLVGHFLLWFPILLFNAVLLNGHVLSWPGYPQPSKNLHYNLEIFWNTAFFLHVLLLWLQHHCRPPLLPTLVDTWLFLQTILTLHGRPISAFNFLCVYRLTYACTLECNVISCIWRLSPTRPKVYCLGLLRYMAGLTLASGFLQVVEGLGGAQPRPVHYYIYQLAMVVPGLLDHRWFHLETWAGQLSMLLLVPFCAAWTLMTASEVAAPIVDLWYSRFHPPRAGPQPRLLILGDVQPHALLHALTHYVPKYLPRPNSDIIVVSHKHLQRLESVTCRHRNVWLCEGSPRDTDLLLNLLQPHRSHPERRGDVALVLNRPKTAGHLADDAAIFAAHQVLVVAPRARVIVEATLDQTEATLEAVAGWREHAGCVLKP